MWLYLPRALTFSSLEFYNQSKRAICPHNGNKNVSAISGSLIFHFDNKCLLNKIKHTNEIKIKLDILPGIIHYALAWLFKSSKLVSF